MLAGCRREATSWLGHRRPLVADSGEPQAGCRWLWRILVYLTAPCLQYAAVRPADAVRVSPAACRPCVR
jgi:hypothetical protein